MLSIRRPATRTSLTGAFFTKKYLLCCYLSLGVSCVMSGQQHQPYDTVSSSVVHITAGNALLGRAIGTGVCLDVPCVHILTNYHVAKLLGLRMRIEGVGVAEIVAGTGPEDEGARTVQFAQTARHKILRMNPGKDLALLTLAKPLASSFVGVSVAHYNPQVGQNITAVSRYRNAYDNATGTIVSLQLELRSDTLNDNNAARLPGYLLTDISSRPGNSGGVICDMDGLLLGIIAMGIQNTTGQIVQTMAIPTSVISSFLQEHNSQLWRRLFASETVSSIATGSQISRARELPPSSNGRSTNNPDDEIARGGLRIDYEAKRSTIENVSGDTQLMQV